MSQKKDDSSLGVKLLARILAGILIAFFTWFFEFVINPQGNTSFFIPGNHTVLVRGINCQDTARLWRFVSTPETGYANKRNWMKMKVWIDQDGTKIQEASPIFTEKSDIQFEACSSEMINVGKPWSINTKTMDIQFRMHPGFELIDLDFKPDLGGNMTHLLKQITPETLLMSAIIGLLVLFPFFSSLFFFDFVDKIIDRYVLKKYDIPKPGHLFIAMIIGTTFLLLWPRIMLWTSNIEALNIKDWFEEYLPSLKYYFFWASFSGFSAVSGYLFEICINTLNKNHKRK